MSRPNICILAAGIGSRLGPATAEIPKSLLPVGGRTILEWQLRSLQRCGVTDEQVLIVTGHAQERIRSRYGDRFTLVYNERYADFNNIYSVHLLAEHAPGDMLLINGDTLFHTDVLARVLAMPGQSSLVVDDTRPLGLEEMKTVYESGRLMRIGKDIEPSIATGEYIGVLRMRGESLAAFHAAIEQMIEAGRTDEWYEGALNRIHSHVAIGMIPTGGLPWIEIDTPEDAASASALAPSLETEGAVEQNTRTVRQPD